MKPKFEVLDLVKSNTGNHFKGVVRAVFQNANGKWINAVENQNGIILIYEDKALVFDQDAHV